jgi:hypothetical protein
MTDDEREVADEDVFLSAEEGQEYRTSSYMPTAYDNLDIAPETASYAGRGRDEGGHRVLDLPRVPKLSHVIGPSAIMLGASLGSGETLFWPLLVARHGWSIYWLFFVGVLTQFFINTEIQRWTVATGESVFRAFERLHAVWPRFFLVLGLLSLGWPGWAASAASVGAIGLGIDDVIFTVGAVPLELWKLFAIVLMVLIWITYQLTPLMYNVVERFQLVMVTFTSAVAIALFLMVGSVGELAMAPTGLLDVGYIPVQSDIALLLGGLAYAGAGGYLNLSQSLWVREKGYGMGRYQGRIKNPIVGDRPERVHRNGFTFMPTPANLRRWRGWWRLVQLEHLLTFLAGLLVVATMLMAIAAEYASAPETSSGVVMWVSVVAPQFGTIVTITIYLVLFFALLTTEYAIVESFVRNSADILYELYGRSAGWRLPRVFWLLLTVFVLWGILILSLPIPIAQPFGLLVLAASMSGVMMWPYTGLLAVLNTRGLPEHTQPGWPRLLTLWWGTAFFGYFSVLLIGFWLTRLPGLSTFATARGVVGSAPGGYVLFAVAGVVQVVVVILSARAKRRAAGTVEGQEAAQGLLH